MKRFNLPTPARSAPKVLTCCVVDRRVSEHAGLLKSADDGAVRLVFVTSAREALATAHNGALNGGRPVDVWLVNVDLPDRSGLELVPMLRAVAPDSSICLMSDEYSVEAEQLSWKCGASMYRCKPSDASWLDVWVNEAIKVG